MNVFIYIVSQGQCGAFPCQRYPWIFRPELEPEPPSQLIPWPVVTGGSIAVAPEGCTEDHRGWRTLDRGPLARTSRAEDLFSMFMLKGRMGGE